MYLPILVAALLSSTTQAETVTVEQVQEMIRSIAPQVEQAAGRRFLELPEVHITGREELRARSHERIALRYEGRSPERAQLALQNVDDLLDNAVAIYSGPDETFYLLREGVDLVFDTWRLPPSSLSPVVECTVVHELTHALQHQHSPLFSGRGVEDQALVIQMMEGHATLVQRRVCLERGLHEANELIEGVMGVAVPASLHVEAGLPGGVAQARLALAAAEAEGGREAVWGLLTPEALNSGEVLAKASAVLPTGWRDGSAIRDLAAGLLGHPDYEITPGPFPPWRLDSLPSQSSNTHRWPLAVGGLGFSVTTAEGGHLELLLVAWRLGSDREAADLVQLRNDGSEEMLRQGAYPGYPAAVTNRHDGLWVRQPVKLVDAHELDALSLLGSKAGIMGPKEVWVADQGVVVLLAASSRIPITAKGLAKEAIALVEHFQQAEGASAQTAMRAMAALDSAPASEPNLELPPVWTWRMDRAHRLYTDEQGAAAIAELELARAEGSGDNDAFLLPTAYNIAVGMGQLEQADRFLVELGDPSEIDSVFLLEHARLLAEHGRKGEAVKLRDETCVRASDEPGCQ